MFEVAKLETLDLKALINGDEQEVGKLYKAASAPGFFYLNLANTPEFSHLIDSLERVYGLAKDYFDQDEKSKMMDVREDQRPSQDRGYKKSFCDETFEMADEELLNGKLKLPEKFRTDEALLSDFSSTCRKACYQILSCLSKSLSEGNSAPLEQYHRADASSDSGLKLIYEPSLAKLADVQDNIHTDSGTLTLLFYDKWGLEAELCNEGKWAFTPVVDGCALINVANSLQRLSGDRLHSPLHRVTQPVDGFEKRYYISYFLRPERAVQDSWRTQAVA